MSIGHKQWPLLCFASLLKPKETKAITTTTTTSGCPTSSSIATTFYSAPSHDVARLTLFASTPPLHLPLVGLLLATLKCVRARVCVYDLGLAHVPELQINALEFTCLLLISPIALLESISILSLSESIGRGRYACVSRIRIDTFKYTHMCRYISELKAIMIR